MKLKKAGVIENKKSPSPPKKGKETAKPDKKGSKSMEVVEEKDKEYKLNMKWGK
jgi:hypothetical protein